MSENKTQHLKRKLTVLNAWALAFGGVIGWGSFVMPGTTFLKKAGTLGTMIAMEAGAFIMLIISYGDAYMINKYPISGGEFVYAERSFGRVHGFICAWFLGLCYINIIPMNATALCLVFRATLGNVLQFGFHYTVAGYDVYLGELLLGIAALIVFAFIASREIHIAGIVQTVMVIILLAGVLLVGFAAILSPDSDSANLKPLFYPDNRSVLSQIISIVVVAPWAFVGFDIVPQLVEESNFSHNKVKIIMDTCIICGCFVYITLNFIAVAVIPDWVGQVNILDNLKGINSILTFSAAYKVLGNIGLILIAASALCAMMTGILCFYVATSRLLYSMARDKLIPSWFSVLNKHSVPFNAVLFCMVVSILAPFAGRNALGWTVDMSSIGGAIGFAYTSLAAYKYSLDEKRIDIAIFGLIGFIFSVIFALLLLIPIPGLDSSLARESYILLIVWIFMGVAFFSRNKFRL